MTPHIGENGNWFLGSVDSGVRARGKDGNDGKSAFQIYLKYNPDYPGDEERWINDFVNGRLVRFTVTFKAAGSPDVAKNVFMGII